MSFFEFELESESTKSEKGQSWDADSAPTAESQVSQSQDQSPLDESIHTTSSVGSTQSVDESSSDTQISESTQSSTPSNETIERVEIDGQEIDVKFEALVKSDAFHELKAAREALESLKAESEEDESTIKLMNETIEAIRLEAQAIIDEIAQDRNRKEIAMREQRQAIRKAAREAELAERKFKQLLENEQKKLEFEQRSAEFDSLSASYKWREFALPHQIEGAKRLALAERAILGDKMGLGKTLTSLIWLDLIKARRVLVVVPADVLRNFEREIAHWTPHRNVMTLGKISKAERSFALKMMRQLDEFVITINYEAWRKDKSLLQDLIDLRFDTVIIDEAHTIKNVTTAAFRGMRDIILASNCCPTCRGPVRKVHQDKWTYYEECEYGDWTSKDHLNYAPADRRSVKYVLPMTGTPILNKPQDLYPLLHLIQPETYARERDFLYDYCMQDYYTQKWTFKPGGLESLTKRLGSRYIARDRKSAGVILPPQEVQIHEIPFDTENYALQWKIIQQLSKHGQILLDSGKKMTVLAMIALITRQRQANVWPGGIQLKDANGDIVFSVGDEVRESLKMDKAQSMIEEFIEGGERVVLFSQFKTPLRELANRLSDNGIRAVVFDGDTPDSIRDEIKIDFDRKYADQPGYKPKWDVVLCNYKTGGVGLNFTSATQMIILDEEWNPGKRDQGYGRIDRIGQTQETMVHVLRIAGTIDEWLANLISEKEDMINGFESSMDLQQRLSEMYRENFND